MWTDDGFDELTEEEAPEEELSEEELRAEKAEKYRMAASFGSFAAIVAGALAILGLTAFLIRMIRRELVPSVPADDEQKAQSGFWSDQPADRTRD